MACFPLILVSFPGRSPGNELKPLTFDEPRAQPGEQRKQHEDQREHHEVGFFIVGPARHTIVFVMR